MYRRGEASSSRRATSSWIVATLLPRRKTRFRNLCESARGISQFSSARTGVRAVWLASGFTQNVDQAAKHLLAINARRESLAAIEHGIHVSPNTNVRVTLDELRIIFSSAYVQLWVSIIYDCVRCYSRQSKLVRSYFDLSYFVQFR